MVSSEFEPLVLAWQPEVQDLAHALRARRRSRHEVRVIGAAYAIGAVAVAGALWSHLEVVTVALVVFLAAYGVLLGPGRSLGARSRFRRTTMLRTPVEVRVVPGVGLTTTTPGSSSQLDWTRVAGFRETERVFVLQLDEARGGPFLMLAKRGLADPADVDVLRTVLEHATGAGRPATHPAEG